jgi:hypothetical protein
VSNRSGKSTATRRPTPKLAKFATLRETFDRTGNQLAVVGRENRVMRGGSRVRRMFLIKYRTWGTNMFREIGVLMVSLMVSGGALAETLECGAFKSPTDTGIYGGANEVTATRSNVTPSLGADYVVAGGSCDFQLYTGAPGVPNPNGFLTINWQKPIDGGISCKAGPPGSTSGSRLTFESGRGFPRT